MAQANYTPIQLYRSTTASAVPTSGNLADGELAINTNDGKLYYKDSGGIVQLIASKAGASGDVVGPASATDNAIVRFDGATGKLVQNSVVTIADSTGDISGVGQLNATTVDTTNIEVTNIKAKDGTAAATIADSTGVVTVTAAPVMTALTASQAVFTTAGKALTSNAITGTGSVVMSASPTLTGTISAAAATLSGNLTLSGGTANGVLYLDGSKVATSGSGLAYDGTTLKVQNNNSVTPVFQIQSYASVGTAIANITYDQSSDIYKFSNPSTYASSGIDFGTGASSTTRYHIDTSGVHVWTVASEAMRLTSTGLGIGTSSPSWKLTVNAASGDGIQLENSSDGNRGGRLTATGSSGSGTFFVTSTSSGYPLAFGVDGTEGMRLTSTGLGIGTSSPGSFEGTVKTVVGGGSGSPVLTLYGGNATYSGIYFADGTTGNEKYRGFFEYDHSTDALRIGTTGATKATLDSSGNLGLGVTPSAWGSAAGAYGIQLNGGALYGYSTTQTGVAQNAYLNASLNWIYRASAAATLYRQDTGAHNWLVAASGTAGNAISFTQALTLDASGNLLLNGTSAPASSAGNLVMFNGTAPTGNVTNGCTLFCEDVSSSSELKVRDEAGNVTTLSPHNFSLIPEGPSEDMAWSYYSERDGRRINIDMLKAIRLLEKISGEQLVYES